MTSLPSSPAHLLTLIANASTIDEADKLRMLEAIQNEAVTDEIMEDIARACIKEARALQQKASQIEKDIDAMNERLADFEQKEEAFAAEILNENKNGLREEFALFNQECTTIENEVAADIETDVRAEESTEADAIRKQLQSSDEQEA